MSTEAQLNITKFLGLYYDDAGDTDIPDGSFSQLQNFRVLDNFKLRKRGGYRSILPEPFGTPIRGQWHGKMRDRFYHIIAVGGKAYSFEDGVLLELGDLEDAPTNIFLFNEVLFFQDGKNYKRFTAEQIILPEDVEFDSTTATGGYPKTVTLAPGTYRMRLGGGKGNPTPLGGGFDFGGRGGTIHFTIELSATTTLEIRKITNQVGAAEDYGASYWLLADGEVLAAVGGGGSGAWFNGNQRRGGDGGGDVGGRGDATIVESGHGGDLGVGGLGGENRTVSSTYKIFSKAVGSPGHDWDDGADAGKGGAGAYSHMMGGCGYAGGGGGAHTGVEKKADPSWWYDAIGTSAGGSSYVDTSQSGLTLFENSQGTNNGPPFVKISTIRSYAGLEDAGYAPIVYASVLPDGTGGTALEPINSLSARRRQRFNGDGVSTAYKLVEKSNYSVYEVYVGDELQILTTDYSLNGTNDIITFTQAPPSGINNVEIRYMKSEKAEGTEEISKHLRSRVYGGKNDNRVFLYGNGNRIVYSDLADGVPSAEYFPVVNTMDIGTTQYAVTGLSVQYDRMLIHKEVGTWWTHYDYNDTLMMANFPVYPLNDNVGSSYIGVEKICENNPFVIHRKRVWQFVASNIRDERNVVDTSSRVQPLLDELDFEGVFTIDYDKHSEYWIVIGRRAYIYNYSAKVWYYFYFADEMVSVVIIDDKLVFGTAQGDLVVLDGCLDDNGEAINAFAETGWIGYNHTAVMKYLSNMWVQIYPESDTSAEVYYQVDWGPPQKIGDIRYKNINFEDIDFSDFTFSTNYNPKSFRLKPKAKKFVYIKFTVVNNQRNRLTMLGLSAPAMTGDILR